MGEDFSISEIWITPQFFVQHPRSERESTQHDFLMDNTNSTFLTPNKASADRKRKSSDVFAEDFAAKRFKADDNEGGLDKWNQRKSPSPAKRVEFIPQLSEVKYSKKLQEHGIYANLGANACFGHNNVREKYFFHGISRHRQICKRNAKNSIQHT